MFAVVVPGPEEVATTVEVKSKSLSSLGEGRPSALGERLARHEAIRVLSLDGGGYLGLASAAFIDGIERHFRIKFHECFDLFCGTSTGAIIALALAFGRTGAQLLDLYETLGRTVFKRRGLGICRARYTNRGLQQALISEFGEATLGDLLTKSKTILVTAFNLTTGMPRVFKTNHSRNLTRDGELSLVHVAMASSAAPVYFPVVRFTNPHDRLTECFCDGGVAANHPALLGFAEALCELGAPPNQVHVLSISTPRVELGERPTAHTVLDRGIASWWRKLPSIFIDSNSRLAHEVLCRIVASYPRDARPRYERIEMPNRDALAMDDVSTGASDSLRNIGATMASSNDIRRRVGTILEIGTE